MSWQTMTWQERVLSLVFIAAVGGCVAVFAIIGVSMMTGCSPTTVSSSVSVSGASLSADGDQKMSVQEELGKQALESAMSVQFAEKIVIDDEGAHIGFSVPDVNEISQEVDISQSGSEVFSSGIYEPGTGIDLIDAGSLHDGAAKLTITGYKDGYPCAVVHYTVRVLDERG